ncbi:MAG: hypothetical protein ABSG83_09365 [Roseiarcus sp.]|jgi:hypothetical protein
MTLREIVHTCTNPHVASAALASIGGDFATRFAAWASRRNMAAGALAAQVVREFSIHAADSELDGVDEAARGADQPILTGLRYILAQGLRDETEDWSGNGDFRAAPRIARAGQAQWCCA